MDRILLEALFGTCDNAAITMRMGRDAACVLPGSRGSLVGQEVQDVGPQVPLPRVRVVGWVHPIPACQLSAILHSLGQLLDHVLERSLWGGTVGGRPGCPGVCVLSSSPLA